MPILIPSTASDENSFAEIAQAKRGQRCERLLRAWPRIKARYEEYARLVPRLENLSASAVTGHLRTDCLHCYDGATKPLDVLRRSIAELVPVGGSTLCQYCLLGELDAIDHYVPKSLFPEFSVFPRNLVPSCPKCNRLKGDKWVTDGVRDVINLYYDNLPAVNYLVAEVDFSTVGRVGVHFSLRRVSGISKQQLGRLRKHFEVLQLIERYNVAGAERVSELVLSSQRLALQGRVTVARVLEADAAALSARHGANYWKAVLTRQLTGDSDFFATIGAFQSKRI